MSTPSLITVAAFLKRRGAGPKLWPREKLLPWLEWHWKNGGVGIVHDRGRVLAVAVGRCVNTIGEAEADRYLHREDGAILWIDEIASRHPDGIGLLLNQAGTRFGPRLAVCGHVFQRAGELRILPWKTLERLSLPNPHHGLARRS